MTEQMEKYLKERLEALESEQDMYLEKMQNVWEEKGFYRERYFETLAKKLEVQEALIQLYTIQGYLKGDSNE